ncbi:glycosyltransferase [Actinospica durhamensis]|uniref:Glycosyltransferase n=1 Tax=Actinospica durhamensis TaxID=1508375 RepID=A0A941EVQ0_9ACTN|nr:glycosyltransferase [Actinospica durhamensis]MBR7837247.1 glycosyltransferase [Actinospica durhamensis]
MARRIRAAAPHPGRPGAGRAVVFSARVGAGHDAAADELARRLRGAGLEVERRDFLDQLPGPLGRLICDSYHNMLLAAPWTYQALYGALDRSRALSLQVSLISALSIRRMSDAIGTDARVVVSTYPLASQVLGRMRANGRLDAPVVTYLTDYSVHRLWVAEGVDAHTAVHDIAAGQARVLGAAQVVTVDPAVDPRFVRRGPDSRERARKRMGLPAHGRLALLVGGSWGIGAIDETVRDIAATGLAECVVVCGRNEELRQRLIEQGIKHVYGWVDDMPTLMHASDVLVQNAGGMSVYEARACGLPVVTYRTLPGHGETNAQSLDEAGTARWIKDAADLRGALERAFARATPDPVPEFAADPVTVILGVAPQRPTPASGSGVAATAKDARLPRQRERRSRVARFGRSAQGEADRVGRETETRGAA